MKYMKLTDEQKERHPSIHYTGSVRGMKKLGYWGKHDVCVRCGQYIYNISIWLDPNRSNKTERPKEELPQAYLDILEKREWSVCDYTDDGRVELEWYSPAGEDFIVCVKVSFRHLASNNWYVPKLAAFSESVVLRLATIQLGTMHDHNWYQNWFGLEYFSVASQQPTAQFAVWTKPIAGAKL